MKKLFYVLAGILRLEAAGAHETSNYIRIFPYIPKIYQYTSAIRMWARSYPLKTALCSLAHSTLFEFFWHDHDDKIMLTFRC